MIYRSGGVTIYRNTGWFDLQLLKLMKIPRKFSRTESQTWIIQNLTHLKNLDYSQNWYTRKSWNYTKFDAPKKPGFAPDLTLFLSKKAASLI